MKRLIVALLVGGAVFGAVYGVAATLLVSGGTLQMSTAVDAECDGDGVTLGYLFFDSDDDPSTDNDVVTEAQVGDIDDACVGDQLTVELFGDDDNSGDLSDGDSKCAEGEATIVENGSDTDDNTLVLDDELPDDCTVLEVIASFVNIASQADWP